MIKVLLTILTKLAKIKLQKTGIEAEILKNKKYVEEAKGIWYMIDEDFRISKTVQEKIASKADEFDKCLLTKFPELTQDDVQELRQSIAGEINANKEAVVSNSDLLKQLQESNTKLQAENTTLKDQLSKAQLLVAINATDNNISAAQA